MEIFGVGKSGNVRFLECDFVRFSVLSESVPEVKLYLNGC